MTVGDFREIGKLKKTGNGQESMKGLSKTSIEVTKRGILTNGDYKKMANLGENEHFGKNGEFKGLAKYK